jgi:hypothetical protein
MLYTFDETQRCQLCHYDVVVAQLAALGFINIHSICQEECKSILIEMEMMQKMGTPLPYGRFPLMNLKFKMWLHLKMLIDTEMPLTNSSPPPCVGCNGQEIDMSAFPIQQPPPEDLRLVCRLIEHSLLP